MSIFPDIDATCSSLGCHDGIRYHADPDFLQCLKHLIFILRRDGETHDYRRYIGQKQIVKTDLIPMLLDYSEDPDVADVLLRLLVNLTNPALLLYREELPKDNVGRRHFLELVEILQRYKESFCHDAVWALLRKRLETVLEIDWAERSEDQGLLIERVLVLMRNVLQVPADPNLERRTDNDTNVHDQLVWALHQSGLLDVVLYVSSSEYEQAYHLHALEIIYLVFREQEAKSLADAAFGRSEAERCREEQELLIARQREKVRIKDPKKLPGRHSRFGGTYVVQNLKSISDNPLICHQPLEHVMDMNFDTNKQKQKKNFRLAPEDKALKRQSALSVRLMLREFCIEVLRSAYNSMIRHVKRVLERSVDHGGHDDSYLLWAVRFFMEFNRCNAKMQVELVSESMSTNFFHWVVSRMEHHMEMITSDKRNARLWGKRLHIAMQTYKELIFNLQVLQKMSDEKSQALFSILQNNVFYLHEYREIVLHLLINYDERHCTKAYLRDVMETAAFYFKLMEKFCDGRVVVQDKKKKKRRKKSKAKNVPPKNAQDGEKENEEDVQTIWDSLSTSLAAVLNASSEISLPEEDHPIPFDAAADKSIDDQKGDCMVRIHSFLREKKYEKTVLLLRAAREVWPENDHFGSPTMAPEDELLLLREIFFANLPKCTDPADTNHEFDQDNDAANDSYDSDGDHYQVEEKQIDFEDFIKRLVNPKVIRACTYVLTDWETMHSRTLKAVVTILHRIAVGSKVPAMMYQAKLFRVFQSVLRAKTTDHNTELKKLATFIVRDFIATVPREPKIYAELLFYKSIHEAEMIKNGYEEDEYAKDKKNSRWTDQQEDELRRLFMQNQENPETDEDVIDWLARNLIDQTRTRRQIIMKLKSLGLIFKAPTKRSNAANKARVWSREQDERLRNLYDEFRLEPNCLERIMETMSLFKSRNAVIARMITLGLIADKSEILPSKRGKNRKREETRGFSEDENKKKQKLSGTFNSKRAKTLLSELEDSYKEGIDWLIESLTDALEDLDDLEDGLPIVPISENQSDALKNDVFGQMMLALGLQSPDEMETYWRIPAKITENDVNKMLGILKGEDTGSDDDEDEGHRNESSDEDDAENMFGIWRQQANNALVYHESDNEMQSELTLNKQQNKKPPRMKVRKPKKVQQLIDSDHEGETEDDKLPTDTEKELSISSQQIRSRLNELMDSDEEMTEPVDVPITLTTTTTITEESQSPIIESRKRDRVSSSSDEDNDELIPVRQKKQTKARRMILSDDDDDDDD